MEEYTIGIDGALPLSFQGNLIADATSCLNSHESTRWHEIRIYKSKSGSLVGEIVFDTKWEHEASRSWAKVFGEHKGAELAAWFRAHDPTEDCFGFPAGEVYREKQARLQRDLRMRYAKAVGEALLKSGLTERVE